MIKSITYKVSARLAAGAVGVAMIVSGLGLAMPAAAAGLNSTQIQSILSLLQSFGADQGTINNVSAALNGQSTTGTTGSTSTTVSTSCTAWTRSLSVGSTGADVLALQQFLNRDPDTMVASSGNGSPGHETNYFGPATKGAVMKFQQKYAAQVLTPVGLTTPTGFFGQSSIAEANKLCGSSSTNTTTTTTTTTTTGATGTAVVSAATQPANTIIPANAARVPFTAFTVTANGAPVTLNSVTVQRQGPSVDTDFAGVVLINASTGVQIGISRVLDSTHSATIGSPVVIPAGTSQTFWVAGNAAAASGNVPGAGDIASFAVVAVNTSSTVSGSLPITGASNTFNNTLAIGNATIQPSSYDPNGSSIQPIGTTGYRFSGLRIQAGSIEDLTFKSITWYQSGSASGLQNVMTVVNGTSYPTTLDSTGRYYTTVFPTGIVIPKGQSQDVYVQGDLGANTTASTVAEFDIYRNTDIYLVGNQYGYGITPGGTAFGSGSVSVTPHVTAFLGGTNNPFFQGSAVTVTAGTFSTIQNATSVGAQNIAINAANQPLGGFQTNLTGEAITVQSLKVHFTFGSTSPLVLQNVSLVNQNGSVVAGPFNATCDVSANVNGYCGSSKEAVTFSGSILFPTGSNTYTIQGQVPSNTANGVTIVADTSPASDWTSITGNTTGNSITPSVTDFPMNTMTVKGATLNVANGTSPTSQTVVAGGSNILLATIQLDASQSGENVRLSSLPTTLTLGGSGANADLSACQVWQGTTALNTGSRVLNGSSVVGTGWNFSFDNSLVIPKGTVLPLTITCNLSSGAAPNASYSFAANASAASYSVTGSVSGSTVVPTIAAGSAPTMTVSGRGTLLANTDASAPSYALVAGGTTGVTVNVVRLRASNEAINLQKVGLTLTTTATASSSPADVTQAYIYAGNNILTTSGTAISAGTLLGTATFTGNASSSTSTLNQVVQLPRDVDTTLVIKADLADIGTNQPGTEGHLVALDYLNSQGTGANSGTTVFGSALQNAGSAGVRTFNTIPTVAVDSTLPTTGVADGRLMEFKITADSHGPVGVQQFSFTVSTSSLTAGGSVNSVQLFAYTDPAYSQAVSGTFGGSNGQFGNTISTGIPQGASFKIPAVSNPLEIPAGSTYYFQLKAIVTGVQTGSSVVSTLNGDAAYPALPSQVFMGTSTGIISGFGNTGNFVWSPNATTTVTTTANDWTNGFGVLGLPASGLIQSRSN